MGSGTLSSRASYLRDLDDALPSCWSVEISGVADLPKADLIAACATVAAPRIPLVRAVPPVSIEGAGDSGAESSLSESSESSSPMRPGRPLDFFDRVTLKMWLSSMVSAAPGRTDDTINVRTVRWRSFRSGSAGPPRLFTDRFCRLCSRIMDNSALSSSTSLSSYKYG